MAFIKYLFRYFIQSYIFCRVGLKSHYGTSIIAIFFGEHLKLEIILNTWLYEYIADCGACSSEAQ